MHAWSTRMLIWIHYCCCIPHYLNMVKMPLRAEVGGHALKSHGNYIVNHGKSLKNHGIVFFNFCGNPAWLNVSYCDHLMSVVCRQSTICFKRHLLNHCVDFHQTSQEWSSGGPLSKLFKKFHSMQNSGFQKLVVRFQNNLVQMVLGRPSTKGIQIILIGWKTWLPEGMVRFYPPTRKGSGDIAISLASVRLSVCPSVRPSVRP